MTILHARDKGTFALPEGQVLTVVGSAGSAATVRRVDPAIGGLNYLESWTISDSEPATIGAFAGIQQFLVTCTSGRLSIETQDAVLTQPGGAAATLTGTFAIGQTITAKLPDGVVGTLQFTRTLATAPFTKSNIAGAVANAVNSLSYTLQNEDGGYVPGVDASNQVTQTVGGAVPASILLPLDSRSVYEGDSITNSGNVPSHIFGEYTATGARYYYPTGYNQATAGETLAQMVTQVADVNAQKPDVVTILAGTNDLALGTDTPAQIYAYLMAMLDSYFANGAKKCVICTVMKRSDAAYTSLSAGRKADFDTYNALVRATNRPNVVVADLDAFTPPGDAIDGLHPNWAGAQKIAAIIGAAQNSLITQTSMASLYLDASNLLLATKNPQLTGTGGTKTGTVPPVGEVSDTWTVSSGTTAITCTCSKTTLNGAEAQRIDFGGTAASGNEVVFSNIAPVPAIANKVYEVFVDFKIPAGSQLIRAPSISIANVAVSANRNQTANMGTEEFTGTLRCPGYLKTSASATLGFSISVKFSAGTPVGAIIWAKPVLREVTGFNAANP